MKSRILNYITNSELYLRAVDLVKRIKFKRYENLTLFDVIKVFISKMTKDDIIERANGVAFNFTLAIFPGIIFLFTLIPYLHEFVPEISSESIMSFVEEMMPQSMFDVASGTVEDIVGKTRGGLLTFGALFALYLATNGMMSLIKAFNSCYKTNESRGFIKMRLIATALTFMLTFVLILATLLLVAGNIAVDLIQSIEWLRQEEFTLFLLFLSRFFVIFIMFFLAISFIYYFGPSVHYNWRFFSIGSFIATFLCIAVSYGFSFYISNFATYNKLYGSLGALIALMIYMEILSIVLLVGYEINASIHKAYRLSNIRPDVED